MTTMWGAPIHKRWRGSRLRDPRQARFLTRESLKWVLDNKAYTPWYLVRYFRLLKFKLANPHIITRGMVFLGKGVEIQCTPELAQMEIGRWVHIGDKNTIRCHEGSLRFGDKVVLGRDNVIITPHSAFYSTTAIEDLERLSCENIVHFLKGEKEKVFKLVNEV